MAIAFSFDPLADHQIISFLTHSVNRQSSHCQPHHFISASLAVLKNGILLSADPPHQTPPAPAMVSGGFDWRSNQKIGNRRRGNWAGLCLPIKKTPEKRAVFQGRWVAFCLTGVGLSETFFQADVFYLLFSAISGKLSMKNKIMRQHSGRPTSLNACPGAHSPTQRPKAALHG